METLPLNDDGNGAAFDITDISSAPAGSQLDPNDSSKMFAVVGSFLKPNPEVIDLDLQITNESLTDQIIEIHFNGASEQMSIGSKEMIDVQKCLRSSSGSAEGRVMIYKNVDAGMKVSGRVRRRVS